MTRPKKTKSRTNHDWEDPDIIFDWTHGPNLQLLKKMGAIKRTSNVVGPLYPLPL